MKFPRIAASMPFAHLLGLNASAASAKVADEELDDEADKKDARRAEEDDKKPDDKGAGADDGSDDESDKEKKSKAKSKAKAKGKAEDEQDEDEEAEEDEGDDKEKAARQTERARCKAIFSCAAAGVRPDMAAHFAFNTSMSARSATAMLDAISAGTPVATGLSSRMASFALPNPGANAGKATTSPAGDAAAMILNAGKVRRGES